MGDILDMFQGQDPITTLNYIFQFGEWDYIYTEKQGMMKGTKGAEFFSEVLMDNDPYSAKYFNSKPDRKVNNLIAGLNISITIIKLKNGEYNISTSENPPVYNSSAYDANADGTAKIQYIGNGKGYLNITFQISNKEQALKGKIKEQDFSVNVKNSHTALMTVSYPFNVVEIKGKTSLQFGRSINYQSYNLNALKIAEGIWEIPLIPKQFNGVPINPIDYNYQIKKK